ncbi:MAG: hypothetical protein GYB32_00295 [Algicola sp.]|nr:hypothetical protein [Algicola sp.]
MSMHEAIHAEIARFVELHQSGEDVNDRPRLFEQYKYYKDTTSTGNIEHVYMTENYISPITSALRQFDNYSYQQNYYTSFAWDGLRRWDANNFLGMDPLSDDYENYRNIIISYSEICD